LPQAPNPAGFTNYLRRNHVQGAAANMFSAPGSLPFH
jgi:hypothetical protein